MSRETIYESNGYEDKVYFEDDFSAPTLVNWNIVNDNNGTPVCTLNTTTNKLEFLFSHNSGSAYSNSISVLKNRNYTWEVTMEGIPGGGIADPSLAMAVEYYDASTSTWGNKQNLAWFPENTGGQEQTFSAVITPTSDQMRFVFERFNHNYPNATVEAVVSDIKLYRQEQSVGDYHGLEFKYRIYDPKSARFSSVDPLFKEYPWNSSFAFAENKPISGIDLEGGEYLDFREARVKMIGGEVHINLNNFNTVTRHYWKRRDIEEAPPRGYIGFPTKVGEIKHPNFPKTSAPVSFGAGRPSYNPSQQKTVNPNKHRTRVPSFKQKMVSGASASTRSGAGIMLAVNAINYAAVQFGNNQMWEDRDLVNEHVSIILNNVLEDLNIALKEPDMIPEKYRNMQDLGSIVNVVLTGENPTDNKEIYEIGITIVKEISKNYRGPYEVISEESQKGRDNTSVDINIVVPVTE